MSQELEQYHTWYESRSNYWKMTTKGQEWSRHLVEVHLLIETIERLEFVGKRFDIRYGELLLKQFEDEDIRTNEKE